MPALRKYASSAARQAAYRARRKTQGDATTSAFAAGLVYRRWAAMRKQALNILEQVTGEMEVYSDQRSEPWRDSDRGEAFVEMMESMADIVEALREFSTNPSEA